MPTYLSNLEPLHIAIASGMLGFIIASLLISLVMSMRCRKRVRLLQQSLEEVALEQKKAFDEQAVTLKSNEEQLQTLQTELNDKTNLLEQTKLEKQKQVEELETLVKQADSKLKQNIEFLSKDFGLEVDDKTSATEELNSVVLWENQQTLLEQIKNHLQTFTESIKQLQQQKQQVESQLNSRDQNMNELSQQLEKLKEGFESQNSLRKQIQDNLRNALLIAQERHSQHKQQITRLETEKSQLSEQLNHLSFKITQLEQELENKESPEEINNNVQALEQQIQQLNTEKAQLSEELNTNIRKIETLEKQLELPENNDKETIVSLKTKIKELEQKEQLAIAELEESKEIQQKMAAKTESEKVADLIKQVSKLEQEKQQAEFKIDQLTVLEEELQEDKKQLIHSIQSLKNNLKSLEADASGNKNFKNNSLYGSENFEDTVSNVNKLSNASLWEQYKDIFKQLQERLQNNYKKQLELQESYQTQARELAEKENLIQRLKQGENEQINHISRLEYDLEIKKLLLEEKRPNIQGTTALIIEKQQQDEKRIADLEKQLQNSTSSSVSRIANKFQHFPQEISQQYFERFKTQFSELTGNLQQVPQQFVAPVKEKIHQVEDNISHLKPSEMLHFSSESKENKSEKLTNQLSKFTTQLNDASEKMKRIFKK